MHILDWIVLVGTLLAIVLYGIYKSRGNKNMSDYFLGSKEMPWYLVMFSVISTQASAITFISAPGQAFTDGMRFVQFYFGMPLAMLVVSFVFMPMFRKANVFTAYQFLEQRFDVKTRAFTAMLFLLQRGLSAGLTIYAPALILSSVLGWNIFVSNLVMGGLVIIYTVSGGAKAVAYTQFQQMLVITLGMFIAGFMVVKLLPEGVSFFDAIKISDAVGNMNTITTNFNMSDKYNVWSGLIGGFFLSLAYFGTDQSQVGRYLTGKSESESRKGLLSTAAVKIPMQYSILLIGALLVAFYHFHSSPLFFNEAVIQKIENTAAADDFHKLNTDFSLLEKKKKETAFAFLKAEDEQAQLQLKRDLKNLKSEEQKLRAETKSLIAQTDASVDTNDVNYIFMNFVLRYLPAGLIGLLIAVIFCASWSSTASELNALSSTSVIDLYKRLIITDRNENHYVFISKILTVFWGLIAIAVAQFASELGSMIEAVNVLGSLFYGTVLGVFVVAFFVKYIKGTAVFFAAVIAELIVIVLFKTDATAFLWLNMIGCVSVIVFGVLFQFIISARAKEEII
ncbi:MAG: sodium:solute symporter [Chitinophagales bacterium]|nr:sodium:solute symporter [Chitinophagales bacterium]HRN93794.1 sodium:solute symporter [Chitinophagales bacterium]HRP38559.1 sodium:solute symporter [Chitinophagales bacterium]